MTDWEGAVHKGSTPVCTLVHLLPILGLVPTSSCAGIADRSFHSCSKGNGSKRTNVELFPDSQLKAAVHFAEGKDAIERPSSTISNLSQELSKVTGNSYMMCSLKCDYIRLT